VKHFFERYKGGPITKALIGGSILSVLCVALPPLFGEGYVNIKMLHQGNINYLIHKEIFSFFNSPDLVIIGFLLLTLMLKAVATSVTLNSGGNGGNFAPSLIAGGLLGFLFGFILTVIGFDNVPVANLMLVGMAGVMSGVLYAPLTAIFLIAESSSGYDLFIPLMIVSVMAFLINKFFSSINPTLRTLAAEGKIFTTRHDQNILNQIKIMECINDASVVIQTTTDIREVLDMYRNSNQNTFAVVDENYRFWGILNREQLHPYLLGSKSPEEADLTKLTISPSFEITMKDRIVDVIKMFDESDVWQLPLVSDKREFLGFVSRSIILTRYRALLKEYSE
jgi:CIC family chloride channel protein